MSVLIKGMEMPKDGAFVGVLIWSDGRVTNPTIIEAENAPQNSQNSGEKSEQC